MKNLLIICGGKSAEHEISVISAKYIYQNVDKTIYNPIIVGVSRTGVWYLIKNESYFCNISEIKDNDSLLEPATIFKKAEGTYLVTENGNLIKTDLAFPVFHGPYGEDGTIQGLFEMMDIPYVGSHVGASHNCMDKAITKTILKSVDINVVQSLTLKSDDVTSFKDACAALDSKVLFIKPAFMGSSVGVNKAKNQKEFKAALSEAFNYSSKVLVEKAVANARELECSIIGNGSNIKASIVGEIKPNHEFYSYESKYLDPKGADLLIPAKISDDLSEKVRELSLAAFKALECSGMARVDFLYNEEEDDLYLNEINTIPGFTTISMYPKLWLADNTFTYSGLISKLLALALDAYALKKQIKLKPELKNSSQLKSA
jgi:D-alanine-D-alanine ligase